MLDRKARQNPIQALAHQAQSPEDRQVQRRRQEMRAERKAAEHYRRQAARSEQAFSGTIPEICIIH